MSQPTDASLAGTGERSRAGRTLAALWVLVLVLLAAGAAWLQVLGPPSAAPPARAAAGAATQAAPPAATSPGTAASIPAGAPPAPQPPPIPAPGKSAATAAPGGDRARSAE
jgi:hypothetical protein